MKNTKFEGLDNKLFQRLDEKETAKIFGGIIPTRFVTAEVTGKSDGNTSGDDGGCTKVETFQD